MANVLWSSENGLWKIIERENGSLRVYGDKRGTVAYGEYDVEVVDGVVFVYYQGTKDVAVPVPKYVYSAVHKIVHQYTCIGCKKSPYQIREYCHHEVSPRKFVEDNETTLHMFKANTFYCTTCYIKAGSPTGTPNRYNPTRPQDHTLIPSQEEIEQIRQSFNWLSGSASQQESPKGRYDYRKEEYFPVFVYGSLRNGLHNYYSYLRGNTMGELQAKLDGGIMYSLGYYPVMFKGEGEIIGELMYLEPEFYAQLLQRLDRLENYNPNTPHTGGYVREQATVMALADDGQWKPTQAWVYFGSERRKRYMENNPPVASGDWKSFHEQQQRYGRAGRH